MLTVAEALELPAFEGSQVVAGVRGLVRRVGWVHNVGVPDAADWLNGRELVLTTAINMPTDPDDQVRYVLALIERGVSALGVAVGRYIDEIPEHLRAVGDAHDFPLIEVPYQLRFVDLARAVNERIVEANMAMVTRALDIHQTLTRLVLEGGGITQLAAALAELIDQSISIENERFEALASVNIAPVDEARRYTQQHGRTDPRLVRALQDEILPEIHRTLRPVAIPPMPHVGLEMERILAPVVVHGEIYGYLWIIADGRPLNDLDRMAIESGATIAALMLLYQESVQSAEASLKGSLLTRLIQGESEREVVLTDQALRYGVDLRHPFRALLVDWPEAGTGRLTTLYRQINRLVAARGFSTIVGQFAGQVMVIAQSQAAAGAPGARAIADAIHTELAAEAGRDGSLRIAISGVMCGADQVAAAYEQCREALHIARRVHPRSRTILFDDLGYLHTLYRAGSAALATHPHAASLRSLLNEQGADLFNTLEAYLDAGGNGVATAELLHVHRSTLNYRLERIEAICQVDLSDPGARINLHVALKLLRLFEAAV